MSIGVPVVISGTDESPQFSALAGISVKGDDPNSFDEKLLQTLIDATPSVLPISDYLPSTIMFSLGREVSVDLGGFIGGRIDNLLVTNDGYLVIVETKLYRNQKNIREVITQTLQYGMAVGKMTLVDLEETIRRGQAPSLQGGETIRQCVARLSAANNSSALVAENFDEALENHLRRGEILLLVVSDEIHEAVERVTDWISGQGNSTPFKLGLVELKFFTQGADKLVVPRTVIKTREVSRHVIVVDIRNNTDAIATATITDVFKNPAGGMTQESRSVKAATPPLTRSQLLASIADDDRSAAERLLGILDAYPFDQRGASSALRIGFGYPQEGGMFYPIANLTDEGVWVFLPKALRTLMGPDAMTEFHREANRFGQFYEDKGIEKPDSPSCTVKYMRVMDLGDGFVEFLDAFRTKAIGLLESGEAV
jgi:hypothetical protein